MTVKTVAFVGDSLTAGFVTGSNPKPGGFRRYLRDTWDAAGLERHITFLGEVRDPDFAQSDHSGVGGNTAADMTARVTSGIFAAGIRMPDVWALPHVGTNNAASGALTTAFTGGDYAALIAAVRAIADVPILVGTIPDNSAWSAQVDVINAWLQGASGWTAIEALGATLIKVDLRAIVGAWSAATFSDFAHYNQTGYELVGAAMDAPIRTALGL